MQAGNELIGREMACFCLGAAAQCFEVCWGSLIHLLSSLGEVWQAMSFLLVSLRAISELWVPWALNTYMRGILSLSPEL